MSKPFVILLVSTYWVFLIHSEVVKRSVCKENEMYVECAHCGPKTCEDLGHPIRCGGATSLCRPGCVCIDGYVRDANETCIPKTDCSACGGDFNATTGCGNHCGNSCSDYKEVNKTCFSGCRYNSCDCKTGYVYHDEIKACVLPIDCCCPIPDRCKQTCAHPNPPNCTYTPPPKYNQDGCQCKKGYILSKKDGPCIKIEKCPAGCNGDPHANTVECPLPCPSTCERPNAVNCLMLCEPIGCECEPGYLINDKTGKCVKPEDCPCGNPCGKNEHFSSCRTNCTSDYCPKDDKGVDYCDYPCLPGCVCDFNYVWKSPQDRRCILARDCPPVKCTRPNEIWDPCSSPCLAEDCDDIGNMPTKCPLKPKCIPRCVCKKNFYRNDYGICVRPEDCPC